MRPVLPLFPLICYALLVNALHSGAAIFGIGDSVRLTRSETLLFKGENFLGAPKGQEFNVLQQDASRGLVYVSFFKADGTQIAVTLPADALEAAPPDAWKDLLRGVEGFGAGRYDDTKRFLLRAAQDPKYRALATSLSARLMSVIGASQSKATLAATMPALRDTAEQLCKQGNYTLGLAVDLGADRLAANVPEAAVPSKIDREDVKRRVATVTLAVATSRQALALHRLSEANKFIKVGLEAEPTRPELKAVEAKVQKDLAEADSRCEDAERMRHFPKGEVHALTALEQGLKLCVDHPGLIKLKRDMQGAVEERTAPPITPALLTASRGKAPAAALEEGRKLYTTRCTECHDLELVDSRSESSWQSAVSGMARRAHINDAQKAQILDYLAVARLAVADK